MTREDFATIIGELAIAYDIELRAGRAALYYADLQKYSRSIVDQAARELRQTSVRFPTIAAWLERCKAIATQRAARAATSQREAADCSAPATWETTANLMLLYAACAGVKVGGTATRERALEFVRDELRRGLREEFNGPMDVPRARRLDERKRIVRMLVQEFAGQGESEASTRERKS
jgi:hypothetical protein